MDNSPISKSSTTVVYSQYVVLKSVFFGVTKRLLTIKDDKIELNALNFDPKHQEIFYFADIMTIQFSSHVETQFHITMRNYTKITLNSEVRTQCLCDIYRAWDKYTPNRTFQSTMSYPTYQVLKTIIPGDKQVYMDTKVIVYRTHLELIHLSLKYPASQGHFYIKVEGSDNLVESKLSIPFCLIETIYKTHMGFVIEMRDSLAKHELIFYDMEKTNEAIYKIQSSYKLCTNCYIEVNDEMFDEGFPIETVVPRSYELFFFYTKAYKVLESGHLMPIKVALSDCYLVEIDLENELVIQKYDISTINHIVRMVSGLAGIQITFEDFTIVTYIPPHHHKGLLASNLFTLANWKKHSQEYALQNDFIHSMVPKYNYVVNGWINDEVELGYETELIRKFTNTTTDDQDFYTALHEFNLNARLKNFTNTDNSPLKVLIQIFNKNIKIIMSKEFVSYWEAFQTYVISRCSPEFEKGPLRRMDSDSGVRTPDNKLKNLLNKYQFEISEKYPNIRFSTKTLPLMLYRTEELLKAITILISSRGLFRELAGNKKEAPLYEGFLIDAAKLLDSPYPTLSHLAGCFFRAFCRFSDNTEHKVESMNKNFVLRSKVNLMQTVSEILAKRVLIKNKDQKEHENIYILSILACLRIIKTFVYERKDTTSPEDLEMILKYISTPYYFAIFNFLSRYRSIACVYNTAIILNSFFKNCTSRDMYKSLQTRFLNNSSLILLHIVLVLSSLSVLQRKISVILLSHLFLDNAHACGLICRILPKNLFRKVDFMSNDITKWTAQQWEQLFSLAVKDFNTTTEIWTNECREELMKKLRRMDDDINSRFKYCPPNRLQELFTTTSEEPGEFLLNIRWNHEEYEIRYDSLQNKIPVGKFYLTSLLQDSEQPKLAVQIGNASKLWNDLNVKFIGTKKVEEMAIILKTMTLLYRDYYTSIKDLNTMNHWLRCIRTKEYKRVWYLILQLLYTSLTVDDYATSRFNIKKFVDSDGILILADLLSGLYFTDDHNALDEAAFAVFRENIREDMDYNYTKINVPKQAYIPSLEKSCMIFLIVNIYKGVLIRYKDKKLNKQIKFVYPIPTGKFHILEGPTLLGLINVLLLKDNDLNLEVLEFFTGFLCDKFTYGTLAEKTPLYEFLLYNINPKTIHAKLRLMLEIYSRIAEENEDEGENPVKLYTSFSFKTIENETVENAVKAFPPLKYFPKHLVWKLINCELEEFADIFFSTSYETPQLIWNSYMRESLANAIEYHLQDYIYELVKFSESKKITSRDQVPQYSIGTFDIVYDNLLEEVKCGPMLLRVWITKPFADFAISQDEIPIFLVKLNFLLRDSLSIPLSEATSNHFANLLIILKAHAKAIKVYSLVKYDCFGEILKVLKYLPEKILQWNPVQQSDHEPLDLSAYIQTLCRLIFRAIRLENSENAALFARTKGIDVFLLILGSVVSRINVGNDMQSYNYYSDIQISYEDLKILDLLIRIIVKMLQKCYAELLALSPEQKLQLFLNLRTVSKIPLILFEYVRTYHIRTKSANSVSVDRSSAKSAKSANEAKEGEESFIEKPILNEDDEVIEAYDPATTSVLDMILLKPDSPQTDIFVTKIFIVTKNLVDLLGECSVDVHYITNFIQSGLAWRFLEFLTYFKDIGEVSEENNNPHYHTMLVNIEKICNIFRNIVMFSNEAYIWKMAGATNESTNVDAIVSSKNQASEISRALTKISSPQKLVLCQFFECIVNLIDYTQPRVIPLAKDTTSITNFLGFFSKEMSEPTNLWNSETRLELKNRLVEQILLIIGTKGGEYINLIENFKYKLHQRNLLIDEVFNIKVSQYNKNPKWKLADPSHFIHETLKAIEVFRKSLITGQNPSPYIDVEADVPCLLYNFEEALTAILNVAAYNDSEGILQAEPCLTQLGSLLNDQDLEGIQNPKISNLKSRVLSILIYISRTQEGAQKILANAMTMRNTFKIFRDNTKESVILYHKILKLLENMSTEGLCRQTLLKYGFYVALLESILKVEIYPLKDRQVAYNLLVQVLKPRGSASILSQLIEQVFPSHVQEMIFAENSSHEILETIDNGFDAIKVMWTKLMRQEVLSIITQEAKKIQNEWDKYQNKEIEVNGKLGFWNGRILKEKPVFPEVDESVKVKDVFLKNFNKSPKLDRNINITVFIDDIANNINDLYTTFVNEAIKCSKMNETESQSEEIQNFKKQSGRFVTLLTSLLVGIDQFIFEVKEKEENNLQKQINELGKEFKTGDTEEEVQDTEGQEEIFLSENAISCAIRCMELFDKPMIHPHILSTVLQLLFLIAESHRGFSIIKCNDILPFLLKLLNKIIKNQSGTPQFTHGIKFLIFFSRCVMKLVEEKMILCLLLKILQDPTLCFEAIEKFPELLRKIFDGPKTYLRPILNQCITMLVRNPQKGRDVFAQLNKNGEIIKIETVHDCMPMNFLQNAWKSCSKGWNPYKAKNLLNSLYQNNSELVIEYPAISDYAVLPLVHPKKENQEIEKRITENINKMMDVYATSLDCEPIEEIQLDDNKFK